MLLERRQFTYMYCAFVFVYVLQDIDSLIFIVFPYLRFILLVCGWLRLSSVSLSLNRFYLGSSHSYTNNFRALHTANAQLHGLLIPILFACGTLMSIPNFIVESFVMIR